MSANTETTMSPALIWPDDPQSRIAELEHAIIDAQKREDALIAERDALADRVKAMEDAISKVLGLGLIQKEYQYLDRGIGTATEQGRTLLLLRSVARAEARNV